MTGDLTTLANVKAWLEQGQVSENWPVPAAPAYTVTVAKAAAWTGDAGVVLSASGQALTPVGSGAPGPGQYAAANGVYTFNAAQAGQQVGIAYTIASPPDALLARRITAASAWAKTYMERDILSQDYTETRNGHGGLTLFFANYPVSAVAQVAVNGNPIPPAQGFWDAGYTFTDKLLTLRGYVFWQGYNNVQLAYTAGYAAVPPELEQAVIELVAFSFKERGHLGQQSATFQGQTVSFTVADLPATVKAVLDHWRRVVTL
jgi:hypothetical protein